MSNSTTVTAHGSSRRGPAHMSVVSRLSTLIGALAFMLVMGCSDFHLSASDLSISPSPAVPGDVVTATFLLSLIPAGRHTIVVFIDDVEHRRVTSNQAPPIPVVLELGAATDLIETYGVGEHDAYIRVHASDETTRTQTARFVLNDTEVP